ncbi:hypothetical protein CFAM422_005389 [Trichoderma lentiforme]|uniref:Uncharacterized protein n=1 Tax=Trichoderma lentiforme TaxID=1567552 RepID=A0A9P5CFC0_9HYPO|nr:hypothetical protein CFAM422_005389 [Trichoderma lentiforme]
MVPGKAPSSLTGKTPRRKRGNMRPQRTLHEGKAQSELIYLVVGVANELLACDSSLLHRPKKLIAKL